MFPRCVIGGLTLAALVAAAGCGGGGQAKSAVAESSPSTLGVEVESLRNSDVCSVAADRFWNSRTSMPFRSLRMLIHADHFDYTSHYSRDSKRCLVLVWTWAIENTSRTDWQTVFDSLEATEVASMVSRTNTTSGVIDVFKLEQGSLVEGGLPHKVLKPTADNVAWFRDLMMK
jgi:hypothetical protein